MSELEERGHCWFLPSRFAHPCGAAPPEGKGERGRRKGKEKGKRKGSSLDSSKQIPEGASICSPEGQGKEGG